jgi:hypothetical protein
VAQGVSLQFKPQYHKKVKRYPFQKLYKLHHRNTRNMKKQGNMTPQNVHITSKTKSEDSEVAEMPKN